MQFLQGYVSQPLKTASQGFKKSSRFPDLNWKFRSLLAEIQARNNQLASAVALVTPEPPNTLPQDVTWRYLLTRAYVHCRAKSTQDVAAEFRRVEDLAGSDQARRGESAMVQGRCELDKKNFKAASDLFTQANHALGSDEFVHLYAVLELGIVAMRTGRYEDAVTWFLQALEPAAALHAAPLEEATRGNLGYVYYELGDFDAALKNSNTAAEAAAKLGSIEHQEKWLLDVGRAYGATGESGREKDYYRDALALALKTQNYEIAATALHNLTFIEVVKGDLKQAAAFHAEEAKLNLRGDFAIDFKLDEAFMAASSHEWIKAERLLLELVHEVRSDARRTWLVQAELARVYAGQNRARLAEEWFQKSIETMQEEADRRKNINFAITTLDSLPIFDDYIAFLYAQKEPERALQIAQLPRARTLSRQVGLRPVKQEARVWVRKIEAMLRTRHSVLLAYYEAEHEAYAWIITGHALEMKALGINQNDLETLADEYRSEIEQQTRIDSSPAQKKLYRVLITPVAKLIPRGSHVILVGDSALYRINFEALISDERPPHYWIDDVVLENASSIDLLLSGSRLRRHGRGALIIGAPNQVSPQYPLLPHAHEEVENVKAQFKDADVKVFEHAAATPEAYISSQPSRFKYIEFATHSEASTSDPLKSTIVLSRGPNGAFQLSADQIVKTRPMLNAELVSISGCYSVGKVRTSAEGLLGLQWAFMRAGAHQVVAGLWDVDDKSSPQLMGRLYKGIMHGESAATALRAAKLKMLHAGNYPPPPYYWASLQLYTGF